MPVQVPRRAVEAYLTADVTSFVGRRRELATIRRMVGEARLISLCGVAGVGKTRLAREAAKQVRRTFSDGVWWVELAPLRDDQLLIGTVATSLGLGDRGSGRLLELLIGHVSDKRMLLILDSCEHVLTGCARLVSTLLEAAPELRVMTTSGVPLHIGGEVVFDVLPLSVPSTDPATPAGSIDGDDAVRLFIERAATAVPGFSVTEKQRNAVVQLCRRLDGIPLAIELAAVRLRSLSVDQVLERLDDRFRLLTGGSKTVIPRQQTMRSAIDWSWHLCSSDERRLWSRLSVFAGAFGLDAVEGVCCDEAISRHDVVDLIASLVDKSIVMRNNEAGPTQYRLLEAIRDYGNFRLVEVGEENFFRRRHGDYYQRLAECIERERFGPDQDEWYAGLWQDRANLQAALSFFLEDAGGSKSVFAMINSIWHYLVFYGVLSEGREWLDRALGKDTEPTVYRANALWVSGELALYQADTEVALSRLHDSADLARRLGDSVTLGRVTESLGGEAMNRGDWPRAISLLQEAIDCYERAGGPVGDRYLAMFRLGWSFVLVGDLDQATVLAERCLEVAEHHRAHSYRPHALWLLGLVRFQRGELDTALTLVRDGLRLERRSGCRWCAALSLELLAWIAAVRGELTYAATVLGAASALWRILATLIWMSPLLAYFRVPCERRLRDGMDEQRYKLALGSGMDLSFDQAIAYALNEKLECSSRSSQADSGGPACLTPRERQVAELVQEGMSNREIAGRLVISQRTAEGHIEHILQKLGFTSRSQIAVWSAANIVKRG